MRSLCIGLCLLSSTSLIYADNVSANNNTWKFVIAPYLWGVNLNGNTRVGPYSVPVNQTFGDIFSKLNYAGMVYFSVSKNKLGVFLDALYSQVSTSATDRALTAKATNDYGIFTNAITYHAYTKDFNHPGSSIDLTPYLGARETINDTTIKATFHSLTDSVSDNQTWADPIAGVRADLHFNPTWSFALFTDGGATSSTNYTYRVEGLLGYKPASFKTARFYLGYQLLKEDYKTGSGLKTFEWNMNTFGPMLGVAFSF